MKKQNPRIFNMFFETQWPRLMEIQRSFMDAQVKAFNYHDYWMPTRIERQNRLDNHVTMIDDHRRWMLKQEFGEDLQWLTAWVDRKGNLKKLPYGNGYRGEILQYIYWFDEDDNS